MGLKPKTIESDDDYNHTNQEISAYEAAFENGFIRGYYSAMFGEIVFEAQTIAEIKRLLKSYYFTFVKDYNIRAKTVSIDTRIPRKYYSSRDRDNLATEFVTG